MNVAEQIEILKATISQLEQLDPNMTVDGHVAYPSDGYSGDLDGEITKIEVEVEGSCCYLGVHYN